MFIRWKGRYAYLEHRYIAEDGKVKSRSRYLGQNHLAALAKMLAAGEISKNEFKKLAGYVTEGILNLTKDRGLGIGNDIFRLFENHKIGIFFNDRWLSGVVAKDEYGWRLKDDGGNIVGLCPGIRARQLF
ncbi:hypothetical protein [Pelotomaculum propionicicum]|uniref:Uncharacterized protein n=1 Tax=Pelotomaculum propionicicum TaxID=258475 RepID=A0A4Y7RP90_9FIRM|nr:hypothetical protein [Pelotomaculum propionicicum]NLI11657.1 hypothetical protein [Peptococcaceae bacterium]TEB10795.1 hypothetical protein Pmgp_02110 [Pelotomaculum propionicicum]